VAGIAHSPLADRKGVTIQLPGFGPIQADVPVAGAFYLVDEKSKAVTAVVP
jgi:proline racemase